MSGGISRRQAIHRGLIAAGGLVLADGLSFRALTAAPPSRTDLPPLPGEFPANLRRPVPVEDLNQAVVFTVNQPTISEYGVDLSRCIGSDVLIRGWFKWDEAPTVQQWRWIPPRIHQQGALFGGGITCSALYDKENGITHAQLLDMATRAPDGQLVDAWGQPGLRHGSLSSPAHLDYLFRWCREQMDAGADHLFMDENTAALRPNEGYDDHSLDDFRLYLLRHFSATQDWAPNDARWQTRFKIELTNSKICPDGDMRSFSYRAYLRERGLLANPQGRDNPLAAAWRQFRVWRDDRAWKGLTDRIRAYAAGKDRRVFISANGLVRYVDLQVLGVWNRWRVKEGQVDLSRSQLPDWRKWVLQGHALAGKRVPVVFFHDWGMGKPPFPWLAVAPSQRKLWMRIRGAEIYAAGGFFAFPVLGPFGCDAARDGTLETIARQTRYYQTHRRLYSEGQFLDKELAHTTAPNLSLAVWTTGRPRELAIHVVNREADNDRISPRSNFTVRLPLASLPESADAVSPDWPGESLVSCALVDRGLTVTVKDLGAYAVVRLRLGAEFENLLRQGGSPAI
ncbi:MAG: hypothetical protein KGJ60_15895 [Verrucomicrobiota bacterium]|nr:hypothetical protein [Verrucomicrobiota bacterium]